MNDQENVTIIIATDNNVKTIKRALESITKGIRPANQVVIGDNDSQDGTYDVLCNMLDAKPVKIKEKTGLPPQFDGKLNGIPVKIFRKKRSTIGHTVNVAMQMKWQEVTMFGFMDSNSWYSPDKIMQSIVAFNKNQSIACVVSDCNNHYDDGRVERIFRCSFDMQRLLATFPYDRNFFVRPHIFPKLKNGFNEQMSIRDDYDLMLRISEIGLIYHIPSSLHHNVVSELNETIQKSIIQCEAKAREMASQRRNISNG